MAIKHSSQSRPSWQQAHDQLGELLKGIAPDGPTGQEWLAQEEQGGGSNLPAMIVDAVMEGKSKGLSWWQQLTAMHKSTDPDSAVYTFDDTMATLLANAAFLVDTVEKNKKELQLRKVPHAVRESDQTAYDFAQEKAGVIFNAATRRCMNLCVAQREEKELGQLLRKIPVEVRQSVHDRLQRLAEQAGTLSAEKFSEGVTAEEQKGTGLQIDAQERKGKLSLEEVLHKKEEQRQQAVQPDKPAPLLTMKEIERLQADAVKELEALNKKAISEAGNALKDYLDPVEQNGGTQISAGGRINESWADLVSGKQAETATSPDKTGKSGPRGFSLN